MNKKIIKEEGKKFFGKETGKFFKKVKKKIPGKNFSHQTIIT